MSDVTAYVLVLDDYHAGDVLYLQGLARAMARRTWNPAPVVLHGSGEHAERLLESHGIFRDRVDGVLEIASADEHRLVEQALRSANRKLVALLTEGFVSSIGVLGAERRIFSVESSSEDRNVRADAGWLYGIARQGVVPVVAASARESVGGATGEIGLALAIRVLACELSRLAGSVEVVFLTRTSLPGIMAAGEPRREVPLSDPAVRESASDWESLLAAVRAGLRVLLTNSNRFADSGGPKGSRIVPEG